MPARRRERDHPLAARSGARAASQTRPAGRVGARRARARLASATDARAARALLPRIALEVRRVHGLQGPGHAGVARIAADAAVALDEVPCLRDAHEAVSALAVRDAGRVLGPVARARKIVDRGSAVLDAARSVVGDGDVGPLVRGEQDRALGDVRRGEARAGVPAVLDPDPRRHASRAVRVPRDLRRTTVLAHARDRRRDGHGDLAALVLRAAQLVLDPEPRRSALERPVRRAQDGPVAGGRAGVGRSGCVGTSAVERRRRAIARVREVAAGEHEQGRDARAGRSAARPREIATGAAHAPPLHGCASPSPAELMDLRHTKTHLARREPGQHEPCRARRVRGARRRSPRASARRREGPAR